MKKRTSLAQRCEIVERSIQGESDREIAQAMNLSLTTVRKWRRKWSKDGRNGLSMKLGRPSSGPLSNSTDGLKETIRQMRTENPGWGAETIRVELELLNEFDAIPSRSSIGDFLASEGLSRRYHKHSSLPQPEIERPTRPHEEWEMDAQGIMNVPPAGKVSLINICDVFTTLKVDSYPCMDKRKPSTPDYQFVLRRAFVKYGLPERFALDHDSVYYDNTTASPYPTQFHLWSIALGIQVTFGRKGRPTDQATVERSHQLMTSQALASNGLKNQDAIQAKLDERLHTLAYHYPSRSLDGLAPLVAYPDAIHSGRPYAPEREVELLDLQRVYQYLAQGRWFRQVSRTGQFALGGFSYGIGTRFKQQEIEITFDPHTFEFICLSEDASVCSCLPAQGLTKSYLMGELSITTSSYPYQPTLPFSLDDWRAIRTLEL